MCHWTARAGQGGHGTNDEQARTAPNPNLGPLATPPYYALPLSIVGFGSRLLGIIQEVTSAARELPSRLGH